MIDSKLITAKRREAIAVPAIAESVTIRMKDAAFLTVAAGSSGNVYANGIFWFYRTD